MKTLVLAFPSYLLQLPNEGQENYKKPNKKKPKKELLVSSISFFLSSFFEMYYVLDLSFSEVVLKKPDVIYLDLYYYKELGEEYLNNYYKIVGNIKQKLPDTKIITISKENIKDAENICFWKNEKETLKDLRENKIKETDTCVVSDIKQYLEYEKTYKEKNINYFYFINHFEEFEIFNLKDIVYRLEMPYRNLKKTNIDDLTKNGCIEIITNITFDNKKQIEEIKKIKEKIDVFLKINFKSLNNKEIVEIITTLDTEKIKYQILKHETKDYKQKAMFSLIDAFKEEKEIDKIKNRMSLEVYNVCKNCEINDLIDAILEMDTEYMDINLDFVHMLDAQFTVEEILIHLFKLHPRHTPKEIEKQITQSIQIFEKKKMISKDVKETNIEKKNKFNLKCVYPQREEMLLLYSGFEKGYFMFPFSKTKNIENISKEIFFFFIFSKGIYYTREIAEKLHLLFGECVEFSKENYLKSTQKIYRIFKRHKLCK